MEIEGLGKVGKQQAPDGSWGMGVLAIYSPQRRSKSGNRFGFVRFLDVKWVKELESQLDQIWIEGCKLWVNVAKYLEEKTKKVERRRVSGIGTVVQGKTYADAVKRQQVDKPREARGHEFVARVEDYEWLQGCYVGTARSAEIVPTLQEKFYMEGYFTCRLRAMGGKLVLLDCEDKEELRDLVTSKKRRFDIARFLISTSIMDSILVKRQIRVNGVIYNLKFTEEEQANNLFSIKYDLMPNFKSESENEESWSEVSDYEDEHGADWQTIAEEEVEAGDTWGLYKKDMGSIVIPSFEEEGEFELEKTSNDVRQSKKVDKRSQSQIEEEDSVEVMADSINVDEYLNDAGDREDVGECNSNSNTNTHATTDPIEDSEAIGLELRAKPIREEDLRVTKAVRRKGELNQKKKGKAKARPRQPEAQGKKIPKFVPCASTPIAGGSMGDNGVAAKNEENVIKRLEEMELRDSKAKEEENSRKMAKGQKYTWYQANGKSMSKLNRFLLSEGWLSKWDEARQWGLCRTVSDHCPILLRHKKVDWGPNPFRFFNSWLELEGCRELIKDVWSKANIQGWAGFRLKERLKLTKEALRKWNQNLVSDIDNKVNKAVAEIAQVDLKGERE
ncbi:hypothetical protein SLEP1_g4270 [Rubroshorea leprosula]|uniref:Uncharacterized protein n=1 Tax=Rubroshorea leprosula TaxID=152421 RepID=A0AAV5HXW9_9ROSI|nr:hypothetical protein SLEP1_g4270 [Rubroshorea leprosula]